MLQFYVVVHSVRTLRPNSMLFLCTLAYAYPFMKKCSDKQWFTEWSIMLCIELKAICTVNNRSGRFDMMIRWFFWTVKRNQVTKIIPSFFLYFVSWIFYSFCRNLNANFLCCSSDLKSISLEDVGVVIIEIFVTLSEWINWFQIRLWVLLLSTIFL